MLPASYARLNAPRGLPLRVKGGPAAKVSHLSPPLKGLSRYAELSTRDPLQASILTNWVIEEDRISVRPGSKVVATVPAAISALVPYYGFPNTLGIAAADKFYAMDGTELASGFFSVDWHWTSFTDLSDTDYTIMVNGTNGVLSWNGTTAPATEAVTGPVAETWINPLLFDKTLSHMNRLWFADSQNLAVYYLPLQQKSGEVGFLPFNAIFKRGGHIVGFYTWTFDGGMGVDDKLCVFTSNGECAIYSGVDPDSDFSLVGVFRFDSPMSKHSVINFGGDLYVFVSTGLVPMSTLLRAEAETLGKADQNVITEFRDVSRLRRTLFGWSVILDHNSGHAICNMPLGDGKYQQLVRRMQVGAWSKFTDLPARCWGWLDSSLYYGTDNGRLMRFSRDYLNDDGAPIRTDVRFAWSDYKSVGVKQFKMVRLYTITDGAPRPYIDIEVDYAPIAPTNQPEITVGDPGAEWDVATWDVDYWASLPTSKQNWQGVAALGRVGAPRVRIDIQNCYFAITGLDVIYEAGSVM